MWPTSEVARKVLIRAALVLGLTVKEGSKHTKLIQVHTGKVTMVPRHTFVKRETARAIVLFLVFEMNISEEEVCRALKVDPPIIPNKKDRP